MRMDVTLIATLVCLPTLMTTPLPGSSDNDVCQYTCLDKGVCEVLYIGPPRGGNTKGSCFPARFGGGCSGTPPECQECNIVKNCENSPEPELDGSTNCQQDSDCPFDGNTCEDDPQGRVCYSVQEQSPDIFVYCRSNEEKYRTWEACQEECGEEDCYYSDQEQTVGAVNLKTTSSVTGQSFSGLGGVGQISNRCPATRPCPRKSGKCGNLVGLGAGGKIPACPKRRF